MRQIGLNLRAGGIGAVAAQAQTWHRNTSGTQIVYDGNPYDAVSQSLERSERDLVPEELRNAADADVRAFNVSPSAFADADAWPKPTETLTWHGTSYTVIASRPDEAGAMIGLRVIAYRTPPPDAATVNPATGKRKTYQPPDSTV